MRTISEIKCLTEIEIEEKLESIGRVFADIPIISGRDNYPYSMFSLTDYYPPLQPQVVEDMADLIVYYGDFQQANLIVSEADRGGGPLAHAVATRTQLPYSLANWYPSEVKGQISVKMSPAFAGDGIIYLNGIQPGDRVILVDDLLSSGGTAHALIEAIRVGGGYTLEAIFVGEKINEGGRARVENTGIPVKTLVKFFTTGSKTSLVPR